MTLRETKREKETKFRKEGAKSKETGSEAGRNGGGDIDESPVARVTRWVNEETDIKYWRKNN